MSDLILALLVFGPTIPVGIGYRAAFELNKCDDPFPYFMLSMIWPIGLIYGISWLGGSIIASQIKNARSRSLQRIKEQERIDAIAQKVIEGKI